MDYSVTLTFVVLAYNHSGCIVEHLASIGHLIVRYGQVGKVDLVISDDASKDSTVAEVKSWLSHNRNLFRHVAEYYGVSNVGTCQSFLRATDSLKTTHVKITGGDDVYADENIFEVIQNSNGAQIIGSQPLVLIEGVLHRFHKFNIIHALANAVYGGKRFREHLVGMGCIYTPGLIYSSDVIGDPRVRKFVGECVLVEDLPSWVAISEYFPDVEYRVANANLVFYRRTAGSAYLIAGSRVFADHLYCRKELLRTARNSFDRWLVKNRILLMTQRRSRFGAFVDVGKFVFLSRLSAHVPSALGNIARLFVGLDKHERHYREIRHDALKYANSVPYRHR